MFFFLSLFGSLVFFIFGMILLVLSFFVMLSTFFTGNPYNKSDFHQLLGSIVFFVAAIAMIALGITIVPWG